MTQTPRPPFAGMPAMRPAQERPARPTETSTVAILAIVVAIIGGTVVSFVLAVIALARIPGRNQKGKGLAIGAMVISVAWGAVIVSIGAAADEAPPVSTAVPKVGDCIDPDGESVTVVSCSGPHRGEVYAVFDLPAGDWPGEAGVQSAAWSGCNDQWAATKRQDGNPSDRHFLYPDKTRWSLANREVTCLLLPA